MASPIPQTLNASAGAPPGALGSGGILGSNGVSYTTPGFTDVYGNTGNAATGTMTSTQGGSNATQSNQGNNSINQTIANNYSPATLPSLTPTTTGSSTAQTNTVNPPVVANSNAAQTDLNTINSNANTVGQSVGQQQQVQQANTNAQTQAQQEQQSAQTASDGSNPDDQPITAKDLNDAMTSLGSGQGSDNSAVNTAGTQGSDVNADNTGQVTTTTDANGNQIQSVQAPTVDNSQLNTDLATIQQNANQTIDPLKAQLAQQQQQLVDVSNQQIQAAQDTQNQIQGLLNGTLPLSQGDQAQLTGIQAQYNDLISTAQGAAAAYTQGVTAAGFASGRALYTPELNLSLVNSATQAGIEKVQTLTAEGAAAYAKLQSDLQNSDLTAIQDSYKAMSDALTARSSAIQSMVKDTQDAITQAYTQQQDDINDAFKSATLTQTEKQDVYNDALNNAKFTEQQKQDITDNYYKGVTASQNAEKIAISQEDVAIKAQTLQDSEDNASLAAGNALQTTASGNKYVDGTDLDSSAQAAAIKAGVPLLEGVNAKSMSTINVGEQTVSSFAATLHQEGITDANGNFLNPKGSLLGVKSNLNDFNTQIKSVITDLQKNGDPKVDGDVISTLQNNLLSSNDNGQEASKKMSAIKNALSNGENSVLSNAATGTVVNGATYKQNSDGSYTRIE